MSLITFCSNGDIDAVKGMLERFGKDEIADKAQFALIVSCANGRTDLAEYLWFRYSNIFDISIQYLFESTCDANHIETAQWLYATQKSQINIRLGDDKLFRTACVFGHIDMAKWLYSLDNTIDIHSGYEYAFVNACRNGHHDVASWLYNIDHRIDVYINNNHALCIACTYGNTRVVEWLLSEFYEKTLHLDIHDMINASCKYNHADITEMLIKFALDHNIRIELGLISNDHVMRRIDTLQMQAYRQHTET